MSQTGNVAYVQNDKSLIPVQHFIFVCGHRKSFFILALLTVKCGRTFFNNTNHMIDMI